MIKGTDSTNEEWKIISKPLPLRADEISPNFVQLVEYNRDAAFNATEFAGAYTENWSRLDEARVEAGLPEERLLPVFRAFLPHYARADQLSLHYQRRHIHAATWLYHVGAIAVGVAVLQALILPKLALLILLEIVALITAVILFRFSLCEAWHDKWLNYRHLAERFRTALFTTLFQSDTHQTRVSSGHPLPFYPGPGGWVLEAFECVDRSRGAMAAASSELQSIKKFLIEGWIVHQRAYHNRTAKDKSAEVHHDHMVIGAMLAITLCAALLHLLEVTTYEPIEHLIAAAAIILPAFAAAQHAIGGVRDLERIAIRAKRMAEILQRLELSISEARTMDELRHEIGIAEEIMSTENHEWCVSLSFRRLSLPV